METCVSAVWNSFPGVMRRLHRHQREEYTGEISVVGEPLISFRFRVQSGSCALGWSEVWRRDDETEETEETATNEGEVRNVQRARLR